VTAGGVTFSLYAAIMITGYFFYAQYTDIPVTKNIGRDYLGIDLPSGAALRVMAALGIIFNIQVTCPLITLPIRDILANTVDNVSIHCHRCCSRVQPGSGSGSGSGSGPELIGSEGVQMERNIDDFHLEPPSSIPSIHTPPSKALTQLCTVITVGSVFLCALKLRNNFANICSLIGDVITMINSLLLPMAFYHILYLNNPIHDTNNPSSSYVSRINIYILHSAIALLAIVTAVIGAGGNVCDIIQSKSHFCNSITTTMR
jgi:hypothetical protein